MYSIWEGPCDFSPMSGLEEGLCSPLEGVVSPSGQLNKRKGRKDVCVCVCVCVCRWVLGGIFVHVHAVSLIELLIIMLQAVSEVH